MDAATVVLVLALSGLVLGAHAAYETALFDACEKIGKCLSEDKAEAIVARDAITPPLSPKLRVMNWFLTICALVASYTLAGFGGAAAFIVPRAAVSFAVTPFVASELPIKHFCAVVHRSMVNREADFAKKGDYARAIAMQHFRRAFQTSALMELLVPSTQPHAGKD